MRYTSNRDVRPFHDNETGRDCACEGIVPSQVPTMDNQPLTRLTISGVEEQQRADGGAVALALATIGIIVVAAGGVVWLAWWLFHRPH